MMQYFQARNVNPKDYENYKIPLHLKKIIQNLKKDSYILDFGCGFGQTIKAITQLSNKLHKEFIIQGIDICNEAINFCRSNNLDVFKCENILTFKPQNKFDFIIMTHVLEHLPKDQIIPILTHFKKNILKADGKIYIAVPNAQSNTGCYWAYEDFTHNTLFTAGSLLYVGKMSGFKRFNFLDTECLESSKGIKKQIRKFFLKLYKLNLIFWNRITASSFHKPSPQIFSYEIKSLFEGGGD